MLWTSKADRYLGKVHAKEQMKGLLPCQGPFNSLSIVNEAKESTTFFLWFTAQLIHLLNTPLLLGFGKPRPSHRRQKTHILHCLCWTTLERGRETQSGFSLCCPSCTRNGRELVCLQMNIHVKEFWICQEGGNGPISWSWILKHSLKSEQIHLHKSNVSNLIPCYGWETLMPRKFSWNLLQFSVQWLSTFSIFYLSYIILNPFQSVSQDIFFQHIWSHTFPLQN